MNIIKVSVVLIAIIIMLILSEQIKKVIKEEKVSFLMI